MPAGRLQAAATTSQLQLYKELKERLQDQEQLLEHKDKLLEGKDKLLEDKAKLLQEQEQRLRDLMQRFQEERDRSRELCLTVNELEEQCRDLRARLSTMSSYAYVQHFRAAKVLVVASHLLPLTVLSPAKIVICTHT